jgi:hypothetical protein
MYTIHMKRTNLVLDTELLDQVTCALGVKTYLCLCAQAPQSH